MCTFLYEGPITINLVYSNYVILPSLRCILNADSHIYSSDFYLYKLEKSSSFGEKHTFSWASLVDQTVKNLPAMQETWVQFQGKEDPLEKETASHSSILAW